MSALTPPTGVRTGPILPCLGGGTGCKGVGVRGGRGDDAAWLKIGGVGEGGKRGEGEGKGVAKVDGHQWKDILAKWGKEHMQKGPHYI